MPVSSHLHRLITPDDVKSKVKVIPRQAEVAQGVPGRLRPRIFLTFRHYKGGRSSAKRTGRFYPRKNPWYSLSEAESTSGHMVLSGVPRKKSPVTSPGIDPGTSRLVAERLTTTLPQALSDDVLIQFDLLMMSTVTLETCREIK